MKTFTIKCEMQERWIPYFLGMLKTMQKCGSDGHSTKIIFYSDGDGDFRPKFELPKDIEPKKVKETKEGYFFDAG